MIAELYPYTARMKLFSKRFPDLVKRATDEQDSVSLLGLRLDLLSYLKATCQARDLWKQDSRIFAVARMVLQHSLDADTDPALGVLQP
jgi:hypothetical protein